MTTQRSISESTVVRLSLKQFGGIIGTIAAGVISVMLYLGNIQQGNDTRMDSMGKTDEELKLDIAKLNIKVSYLNLLILGEGPIDKAAAKEEMYRLQQDDYHMRGGQTQTPASSNHSPK